MFCKNCGLKLDDDARFCPNCGTDMTADASGTTHQSPPHHTYDQPYQPYQPIAKTTNTMAVVGFVLSFFVAIAGLVCSIIAYKNANDYEVPNKGLATAGIIISAISIGCVFLVAIPISCSIMATMPYWVY